MTDDERELLLLLASKALVGNTRPTETEIYRLIERIKFREHLKNDYGPWGKSSGGKMAV